jgi:RHS repeat-associated protein
VAIPWHERGLNWQYSAAFAEEGKKKEVVQYFDGTQRNRQSVTLDNTDDVSVVQETMYDTQGRPGVSVLPSPAPDSTLHYFRDFNLDASGVPYTFSDFAPSATCQVIPQPMALTAGAASYYSPNNPFPNAIHAAYVPNAHGYPFSVTQYTPDNTGRIQVQGGVDTAFQPGHNHTTLYYYGKPLQVELDRLFGSEAGVASHFLKNMVVDPNGEVSVTYVDANGKTVATALAGRSPANLDSLNSSVGAVTPINEALLMPENFAQDASSFTLSATTTFLAPMSGSYQFSYNVNPLALVELYGVNNQNQLCSSCYYDLNIHVKDDCNNILYQVSTPAGQVFDTACGGQAAKTGSFTVPIQAIGEYYVDYSLTISQNALNFYDSVNLIKNTNIQKYDYFLLQQLNTENFEPCFADCSSCLVRLGAPADFLNRFKPLYLADSIAFGPSDSTYLIGLYQNLLAECQANQQSGTCVQAPCADKYDQLKADVTPGGQYALYQTDTAGNITVVAPAAINVLTMYTQVSSFPDANGNPDSVTFYNINGQDSVTLPVNRLTLQQFVQNFQSSWADSLVRFHPEYCYYLWCAANSNYYAFDTKMQQIPNGDSAISQGYYSMTDFAALLEKDPFFSPANYGGDSTLYKEMYDSLEYFSRSLLGYSQVDRNILQVIKTVLYCGQQTNGYDTCQVALSCRSPYLEWSLYLQWYENIKTEFYEIARRSNPQFANCTNCYIGTDPLTQLAASITPATYIPVTPPNCVSRCSDGVYTPSDRQGISYDIQTGTPSTPPASVPSAYSNGSFFANYSVPGAGGSTCEFYNVWVYVYDSSQVSGSGSGTTWTCPAARTDFNFGSITSLGNGSYSLGCTYVGPTIPTGVSVLVTFSTLENCSNIFGNTLIFISGSTYASTQFTVSGCSGSDIGLGTLTISCSGAPTTPPPVNPLPASSCPSNANASLYAGKTRVFPEYVNPYQFIGAIQSANPAQLSSASAAQIAVLGDSTCNQQASAWIQTLSRCSANSSQIAQLQAALAAVCSGGYDSAHGYGSSSMAPGAIGPDSTFEAAIIRILGPNAISDTCTSELISMPYPYNHQPVLVDPTITQSNVTICDQLGKFRRSYATSGFSGTLGQYLQQLLGSDYRLTDTQLNDLINSCSNCNGMLQEPITLPAALVPGSIGGVSCTRMQSMLSAFQAKFPGMDTASELYDTLLTNYFNHRLGFTLTYLDYQYFLGNCSGGSSTALLFNQPASTPDSIDDNACVEDLFTNAQGNAFGIYTTYIDSVRQAFRNAYLTRCMALQPSMNMNANLYEYHYTLYYYDQSGNLVKTIPPAGVHLLDTAEIDSVEQNRAYNRCDCYEYADELQFNGTGMMNVPTGSTSNTLTFPFTLELYANFTSAAKAGLITHLSYSGTWTNGYSLYIENGNLGFIAYGDTNFVDGECDSWLQYTPLNQWAYIVVEGTVNPDGSKNLSMFINGTQVPLNLSQSNSVQLSPQTTPGLPITVGGAVDPSGAIYDFNGRLKQFRLYSRTLSTSEIMQNYDNVCLEPANESGLISWIPMSEGYGNIVDIINRNTATWTDTNNAPDWINRSLAVYPAHTLPTNYQYNSLNQVVKQHTPDADTSWFWYDRLGRLAVSQNMEQYQPVNGGVADRFSYTLYDPLNRIIEVGEKTGSADIRTISTLDTNALAAWEATGANEQVTQTYYDVPNTNVVFHSFITNNQQNLRKRVSASTYWSNKSNPTYDAATHYSYDIEGNVQTLWQEIVAMSALSDSGVKRLDYDYDLVSGKVNQLTYQAGKGDQFIHQYTYDADNRVTGVYTSRDSVLWTQEATYQYYLHGPLARMELGQNKVQGVDYAYTLQGWLKAINGHHLLSTQDTLADMNQDGWPNTPYSTVSRDAYALGLGYYPGDYDPNGGASAHALSVAYNAPAAGYGVSGNGLFNGNISYTTLALSRLDSSTMVGYTYRYDQLNRLTGMSKHGNMAGSVLTWDNTSIINDYKESVSYDPNGNIQSYLRNGTTAGGSPLAMDQLTYNYQAGNNKLDHIADAVNASNYSTDIDGQIAQNYLYDQIGNLMKDSSAYLTNVQWTVYGKIGQIGKSLHHTTISYGYDAGGQRVLEHLSTDSCNKESFYIRDAQGNTIAIYGNDLKANAFTLKEQDLYGSSRLGTWQPNWAIPAPTSWSNAQDSFQVGFRAYELTNHLGNVLGTISDKKIGVSLNDTLVDHYVAEVLSQNDYYPGGMLQPGRTYNAEAPYRYGFNGKENDNEVKGVGDQQDYGKRIYDPRVGRFLSVDPITGKYPELTPYQFASNTPIQAIDLDGMEGFNLSSSPLHNIRMSEARFNLPAPKSIPTPKVSLTDAAVVKAKQPIIKGPLITSAEYNIHKGCSDCGTLSAPQPQPMFNNDFERGMVTNPLIQATATTMAVPFVAGGTMATGEWLFTPQAMGWGSLAAGTSDILIQGASTNWDITKYSPASTIGSMAFHNPLGGSLFAIGFQATIKDNGFTVHTQSLSQTATQVSLFATGTMIGSGLGAATKGWAGDYFGNLLGSSIGNSVVIPLQPNTGTNANGAGASGQPYVPSNTYQTGGTTSTGSTSGSGDTTY